MNFTIERTVTNENNESITIVEHYIANLNDGVAEVSSCDDQGANLVPICVQPWNPKGDGTRAQWATVEEVIDWFKTSR